MSGCLLSTFDMSGHALAPYSYTAWATSKRSRAERCETTSSVLLEERVEAMQAEQSVGKLKKLTNTNYAVYITNIQNHG